MKLENLKNNLKTEDIKKISEEISWKKIVDKETDGKIIGMLQKLVDLKNKVNEIDRKIKEEAVGLNEYGQFKKDLSIAKDELLAANSVVSRFFKEKKNGIYSFDEIQHKIDMINFAQNKLNEEEKIASQN